MCNTNLPKTLINAQQLLKYLLQRKFAIINKVAMQCPIVLKFDMWCIMHQVITAQNDWCNIRQSQVAILK